MEKISKQCLMALEGGLEQSLLRYLNNTARWKVAQNENGGQYAQLAECTVYAKKRDWKNGIMVSLTATFRNNRVVAMYGTLQWQSGETEPFEPLAKEDLARRLNAIVDVAKRRKGWELFTGYHGVAIRGIQK